MLGIFKRDREKGASLIEFALLMPLLLVLIFGIVDFGWALTQHLDVRHLARETGRLATVDATGAEIVARACAGDVVAPSAIKELSRDGSTIAGEQAAVTVEADLAQLTGFFSWLLSGATLSSTVEIRLEQDAIKWDGGNLAAAPLSCP